LTTKTTTKKREGCSRERTTGKFAIKIEDDLRVIRHLAKGIFALAEEEHDNTEYGDEILCFARMIMEKIDTLQEQREVAAGQRASLTAPARELTPAEHSA
jgi:hypothetical protein